MSAPSDDELQNIIDVLLEQQKTIDTAYEEESGFVCNQKIIDIREARANSAECHKMLTEDIQFREDVINKNKKTLLFLVEFEEMQKDLLHAKKQQLRVIPAKLDKKIEVIIHDYSRELTRVRTTYKSMKQANNKALGIARNRIGMTNNYNNTYGKTEADYNYSHLHDAVHTSRTIDTTARNPYVMYFE